MAREREPKAGVSSCVFRGEKESRAKSEKRRGVKTSSTPRGGSAGGSDESSRKAERERPDGRKPGWGPPCRPRGTIMVRRAF